MDIYTAGATDGKFSEIVHFCKISTKHCFPIIPGFHNKFLTVFKFI